VPELSRFFGVIIRMYAELGGHHHRPHFHAYYQDHVAVFSIDPVELIVGELPKRQQRLVLGLNCINGTSWRIGIDNKQVLNGGQLNQGRG
jgi:hypothetical protein